MFKLSPEKSWRLSRFFGYEKYFEIAVSSVAHTSPNYILVEWNEQGFWLPKSEISIDQTGSGFRVTVPKFLMDRMNRVIQGIN